MDPRGKHEGRAEQQQRRHALCDLPLVVQRRKGAFAMTRMVAARSGMPLQLRPSGIYLVATSPRRTPRAKSTSFRSHATSKRGGRGLPAERFIFSCLAPSVGSGSCSGLWPVWITPIIECSRCERTIYASRERLACLTFVYDARNAAIKANLGAAIDRAQRARFTSKPSRVREVTRFAAQAN